MKLILFALGAGILIDLSIKFKDTKHEKLILMLIGGLNMSVFFNVEPSLTNLIVYLTVLIIFAYFITSIHQYSGEIIDKYINKD